MVLLGGSGRTFLRNICHHRKHMMSSSASADLSTSTSSSSSASSTEGTTQTKILFLHGLESGPGGSKVQYLKRKFGDENVVAPDLRTGTWTFTANSYLAHAFYNLPFIFVGALNTSAYAGMLNGAMVAAENTLAELQFVPDCVVASSMGGAIALEMMRHGMIKVPVLLLAPAFKNVKFGGADTKKLSKDAMDAVMDPWYEELLKEIGAENSIGAEENKQKKKSLKFRVIVVHGDQDTVVNIEDSQELCDRTGAEFICAKGADHPLNNYLLDRDDGENKKQQNHLEGLVKRMLEKN